MVHVQCIFGDIQITRACNRHALTMVYIIMLILGSQEATQSMLSNEKQSTESADTFTPLCLLWVDYIHFVLNAAF